MGNYKLKNKNLKIIQRKLSKGLMIKNKYKRYKVTLCIIGKKHYKKVHRLVFHLLYSIFNGRQRQLSLENFGSAG